MLASVFFEFNLPNATTWFYFSLLLAVALFFKFSRVFSLRNWDVLALFLLVPGLLLRQEAVEQNRASSEGDIAAAQPASQATVAPGSRLLWLAYLWLLCGSGYFLARCLMDLALVRRPVLGSNLNLGGLAWLGLALFVCLVVVAVRRPVEPVETASPASPPLPEKLQKGLANALNRENGTPERPDTVVWVGRTLALVCQLAVVVALVFIGYWHFQDAAAGMAAATGYLLLPYTASYAGEFQHVWPAAFLLWAVAAYRAPLVAGMLVGLATGSICFPILTLPLWLSFYWKRGAGRFFAAFVLAAGLSVAVTGFIFWLDGELARIIQVALEQTDWQPWNVPTAEGFWRGVHWAYRVPIFIAYVAFVLATSFWPSPKNLGHLIALLAALLIGIQFWFAYKGGVYVLWYLPFLLLLTFRPNLSDRFPPAIQSETDWVHRLARRTLRSLQRRLGIPEPAAPVAK